MEWLSRSLAVLAAILSVGAVMLRFSNVEFPYAVPVETADVHQVISEEGKPCDLPLLYSIGSIDPRFDVSKDELIAAAQGAEAIWEIPLGREIFIKDESADLLVNLVYDERQSRTDMLKTLLERIDTAEGRYKASKKAYDAAVKEIEEARKAYETHLASWEKRHDSFQNDLVRYDEKLREYEQEVTYWNARGGAPEKEYEKLNNEQDTLDEMREKLEKREKELKRDYNDLENERKRLQRLVKEVNELVVIVNRYAKEVNQDIETYNESAGGDLFITGLYTEKGANRSIDIYQFHDRRELVLILAHELGHAIGLGHAKGERSVMYERLSKEVVFSEEDRMMFMNVCGK